MSILLEWRASPAVRQPWPLLNKLMVAVAVVLVLLLGWRALVGIDPYFDTFAYHLPFAARLVGLCPADCYTMNPYLEARYEGFPKAYHALQAAVWRLSGTPRAVDALALALLVGFALYLRRRFAVPIGWTIVGLIAVPLVQIHTASTYVDLPLNLLVATAVLAIMEIMLNKARAGWAHVLLPASCLSVVANSKLTMIPLAAAVGAWLLAVVVIRSKASFSRAKPNMRRWMALLTWTGVAAAVVFASAISNLLRFGNPVYPVRVEIAGMTLPGTETAPTWQSLSPQWSDVSPPLRWLASVLELGGYAERPLPWTYDQGNCLTSPLLEPCLLGTAPSFRMGGYFVAYVLFLLVFLADRLRRQDPSKRRVVITTVALTTLLAAFFPHSHELRYVMFWMITLVSLALICTFSPALAASGGKGPRRVLGTGMLVALAAVVLLTRGEYLMPEGRSVADLIQQLGIDRRVQAIEDETIVCVDQKWQPFTFLFAPVFHPGRSYTIFDGPIGPCTVTIGPPPPAPVSG